MSSFSCMAINTEVSVRHGQTDRPKVAVFLALAFELSCAQQMRICQACGRSVEDEAELKVSDERLLFHMATVTEGVAVEEDIAGNSTTF